MYSPTRKEDTHMPTTRATDTDQPYLDTTTYGNGPDDAVTDTSENGAVTHDSIVIGGMTIAYTATAGHLVTINPISSKPNAKMFYVAFTADGVDSGTRPITFFYNGGPGASSVFVLLGSFAPKRLKTLFPHFTPPPYALADNTECLLDVSDLVFINPIGTGYSAAVAPFKNKDFWGVDQDATSIKQFIKRYLTRYNRWNSPKFLYGESYGTARSCVLAWMLHEDGIDLNGVSLQSSILDYRDMARNNLPGMLLPTFAADAYVHQKVTLTPLPPTLEDFLTNIVEPFAAVDYTAAVAVFPKGNPATVQELSKLLGISTDTLQSWNLNVLASTPNGSTYEFLVSLLPGQALGIYDGSVAGDDLGIAANISPLSGSNDPTMAAINGAYTVMWNWYLNNGLQYTSVSAFTDLNNQAFEFWDFNHIDPTGQRMGGLITDGNPDNNIPVLYTGGDLAATMSVNIDLKVLSLNGYFDAVTPYFQTWNDLQSMNVDVTLLQNNLSFKKYESGHMIYLHDGMRVQMKKDLIDFYKAALTPPPATMAQPQVPARRKKVRRHTGVKLRHSIFDRPGVPPPAKKPG
jgi:carboxypeptidase C (cathepsin A)